MSAASKTVCPAAPDTINPAWQFQEGPTAPYVQKRGTDDNRLCTFRIRGEDHTLGNALRWVLTSNRRVELAAYAIPHPHSGAVCLRVQSEEGYDSVELVKDGCRTLGKVCEHLEQSYQNALFAFDNKRKERENATIGEDGTADVKMSDASLIEDGIHLKSEDQDDERGESGDNSSSSESSSDSEDGTSVSLLTMLKQPKSAMIKTDSVMKSGAVSASATSASSAAAIAIDDSSSDKDADSSDDDVQIIKEEHNSEDDVEMEANVSSDSRSSKSSKSKKKKSKKDSKKKKSKKKKESSSKKKKSSKSKKKSKKK